MEFDKNGMTLEEAVAIIKEIEPQHERTNSGTAEDVILQAVHNSDIVPVVRCRDCVFGTPDINRRGEPHILCAVGSEFMLHEIEWFCADGERRKSVE